MSYYIIESESCSLLVIHLQNHLFFAFINHSDYLPVPIVDIHHYSPKHCRLSFKQPLSETKRQI